MTANIAEILLSIEAVSIDPNFGFTWASGIKSPIYCDNRILLSYPEKREVVIQSLINLVKKEFSNVEVLAGTATAGIPHASFLADRMKLPMVYVRSSAKSHGKQKTVEGRLRPKQKVLVVEDLISTGKSSLAAVKELKKAEADVIGVISIFSYGTKKAKAAFEQASIKSLSLASAPDLIQNLNIQQIEKNKVIQFLSDL